MTSRRALTRALCLHSAHGRGFGGGLRLAGLAARQPVLNWAGASNARVPCSRAAGSRVRCGGWTNGHCSCSACFRHGALRAHAWLPRWSPLTQPAKVAVASALAAEPAVGSVVAGNGRIAPAGGHAHARLGLTNDLALELVPAAPRRRRQPAPQSAGAAECRGTERAGPRMRCALWQCACAPLGAVVVVVRIDGVADHAHAAICRRRCGVRGWLAVR